MGLLVGLAAVLAGVSWFVADWVKPLGDIFLNLLKLVAMPLVFASLVTGVLGLSDVSKLSRMGVRTLIFFLSTTVIAITVGLLLINTFRVGERFPAERRAELLASYGNEVTVRKQSAQDMGSPSPLKFLAEIVPENVVGAASDNRNMLQVVLVALLFGLAIVLTKHPSVAGVKDFIVGLNQIILRIIDFIMGFAPIGVFALMAALTCDFSGGSAAASLQLFATLGLYGLVVAGGIVLVALGVYPTLLKLFTGIGFKKFYRTMFPVQLVAFSTSSSAATLPVNMEQVERGLGVRREVVSFVLPVGVTINMDGTSLYQAVAAVFIAQVFGIDLTLGQQLTIVLTATLASIGSAGVPGAGLVMLIIVLESVGLPVEGLALILAIDRPLDMLRTVLNVTGDALVAAVVDRTDRGEPNDLKFNGQAV